MIYTCETDVKENYKSRNSTSVNGNMMISRRFGNNQSLRGVTEVVLRMMSIVHETCDNDRF